MQQRANILFFDVIMVEKDCSVLVHAFLTGALISLMPHSPFAGSNKS